MKISINTPLKHIFEGNGYGYATTQMVKSLERLGYDVSTNDKTAEVGIVFNQPHYAHYFPGQYKILYHPWESTQLLPPSPKLTDNKDWLEIMNSVDEVWTPSPLMAKWYTQYSGITVPVYVYEHGVDSKTWAPRERVIDGKFKMLHMGAEAARKGFKEVADARRLAFPKNRDVELNFKLMSEGWNIGSLPSTNYINKIMTVEELVELFWDNHLFVYPSYGEGFGLTPLQAMATGMPTATVEGWAPYAQFLDENLSIGSRMVNSPFQRLHPGMMLKPDINDVVSAMRYAYENYEEVHARAQARVGEIIAYYDWDRLTSEAFERLATRLENSSKILAR